MPIVVSGILLCTSGKLVKNNMEVVRAIFSVGIIFSLIVYESGSIWSSAIVHGIWNVIIIGEILNINIYIISMPFSHISYYQNHLF